MTDGDLFGMSEISSLGPGSSRREHGGWSTASSRIANSCSFVNLELRLLLDVEGVSLVNAKVRDVVLYFHAPSDDVSGK